MTILVNFYSLASSSSANCYLYDFAGTKVLVDVGLSAKQIKEKLNELGIDLKQINVILLTHEHSDHIKGLKTLSKQISCPIWATKGTLDNQELKTSTLEIVPTMKYLVDEVEVEVLKTSHDANDSVGYIFRYNDNKYVHVTDTGYMTTDIINKTKEVHTFVIESNYEENVLMLNTKYPFTIKKRILSDKGHLSNVQCNEFLKENTCEKTKNVIFAHLSENNNACDLVEQINENIEVENKVVLEKSKVMKVKLCK